MKASSKNTKSKNSVNNKRYFLWNKCNIDVSLICTFYYPIILFFAILLSYSFPTICGLYLVAPASIILIFHLISCINNDSKLCTIEGIYKREKKISNATHKEKHIIYYVEMINGIHIYSNGYKLNEGEIYKVWVQCKQKKFKDYLPVILVDNERYNFGYADFYKDNFAPNKLYLHWLWTFISLVVTIISITLSVSLVFSWNNSISDNIYYVIAPLLSTIFTLTLLFYAYNCHKTYIFGDKIYTLGDKKNIKW